MKRNEVLLIWTLIGPAMILFFYISGTLNFSFLRFYLPVFIFSSRVVFAFLQFRHKKKVMNEYLLERKRILLEEEQGLLLIKNELLLLLAERKEEKQQSFDDLSKYFNARGIEDLDEKESEWFRLYTILIGEKRSLASNFHFS